MLCGETVAVCCENRTEHTDTARTTKETYQASATEPNRIMLCGEIVAVCCENRTEHTDTARTTQETHQVSATEPNRIMLFVEHTEAQSVSAHGVFPDVEAARVPVTG
jgi:hypothetical protein